MINWVSAGFDGRGYRHIVFGRVPTWSTRVCLSVFLRVFTLFCWGYLLYSSAVGGGGTSERLGLPTYSCRNPLRSEMAQASVHDGAGPGHLTPADSNLDPELQPDYLDGKPVSPLTEEDDRWLADQDTEQFADAEESRSLMPPPKGIPTGRSMRIRMAQGDGIPVHTVVSPEGRIDCRDGEAVYIKAELLKPDSEGLPQRIDTVTRKKLLNSFPEEVYSEFPTCWFSNWVNLAVGVAVNPTFRQAVMDISDRAEDGGGFVSQESDMETDTDTLAGDTPDVTTLELGLEATVLQEDSSPIQETEPEVEVVLDGTEDKVSVGQLLTSSEFKKKEEIIRESELLAEDVRMRNEEIRIRRERQEQIEQESRALNDKKRSLLLEKKDLQRLEMTERREARKLERSRGSDSDSSVEPSSSKGKMSRKAKPKSTSTKDSPAKVTKEKDKSPEARAKSPETESGKRTPAPSPKVKKPVTAPTREDPDTERVEDGEYEITLSKKDKQKLKRLKETLDEVKGRDKPPVPKPRKAKSEGRAETADEAMDTSDAGLSLPPPTVTPQASPPGSPKPDSQNSEKPDEDQEEGLASDSDEGDAQEQASSKVEQEVWDNARTDFKIFIPASLEECKKNTTHYACPGSLDLNDESDDEEWIRMKSTDRSANKYYKVLFSFLNRPGLGCSYYTYEQRTKLQFAARKYDSVKNRECPFSACVDSQLEEKAYSTQTRFIRHLVEQHMHHRPEYECVVDRGRANAVCNGELTTRRGEMIRHLKEHHKAGVMDARKRVLSLHDALWEKWNQQVTTVGSLRATTQQFCEVSPKTSGKLEARFAKVSGQRKFEFPNATYEALRAWRRDGEKRPREPSPSVSDGKRSRADAAGSVQTRVTGTSQRQASPITGRASVGTFQQAWGTQSPVTGNDWFKKQFPGLPDPGQESQTMSVLGRRKPLVLGGRGNPLVQPTTPVGGGRGAPRTPVGRPPPSAAAGSDTAQVITPVIVQTPVDALLVPVRHGSTYFDKTEVKSHGIQDAAFKRIQERHQELTVQYVDDVVMTMLNGIHHIQVQEKAVLKAEKDTELEAAIANARKAEKKAKDSQLFYSNENMNLRQTIHDMEIQFIGGLGVRRETWDGTLDHMERLCAAARAGNPPTTDQGAPP